jgi:integrase
MTPTHQPGPPPTVDAETVREMWTTLEQLRQQLADASAEKPAVARRTAGPAPTVPAFGKSVLGTITNADSRRTYRPYIERLTHARPCLAPGPDGEPVDPDLCDEEGCWLDDDGRHRDGRDEQGRVYRLDNFPTVRLGHILLWIERKEIARAERALARRILAERRPREPGLTLADIDTSRHELPPGVGVGGMRSFLNAAVRFFDQAVKEGWIEDNPARGLKMPDKPSTRRRALLEHELKQIEQVIIQYSSDPELDLLFFRFVLEAGARISEVLKLRIEDIDPHRQTLWIGKKGQFEREHPVSMSLIIALLEHADARGAFYDTDHVFHQRDADRGYKPLDRYHVQTLWKLIRRHCKWAGNIKVSTHTLRKSVATTIERLSSERVARSFIGHFERDSSGTPYLAVNLEERALALEYFFGEPHPLAAMSAAWLSPEVAGELARRRLAAYHQQSDATEDDA